MLSPFRKFAMEPGRLQDLAQHIKNIMVTPDMAAQAKTSTRTRPRITITGDTATVHVRGVLMNAVAPWAAITGTEVTLYSDIVGQIEEAQADPSIRRIQLMFDSPGGAVDGVADAVRAIRDARTAGKQCTAYIEGCCCSAAFWLASQCSWIDADRMALVGSVGVYTALHDDSKAFDQAGVQVHIIRSGVHKGTHVPGVKLLDENLQAEQEIVNKLAGMFETDVRAGRSIKGAVKWLTGATYIAEDAVALNLIDAVHDGWKAFSTTGRNEQAVAGHSVDVKVEARRLQAEGMKPDAAWRAVIKKHPEAYQAQILGQGRKDTFTPVTSRTAEANPAPVDTKAFDPRTASPEEVERRTKLLVAQLADTKRQIAEAEARRAQAEETVKRIQRGGHR